MSLEQMTHCYDTIAIYQHSHYGNKVTLSLFTLAAVGGL